MTEPATATFIALLNQLLAWIGLVRQEELRLDERKRSALNAVYTAISETKMYLANSASGEDYDRDVEAKLARLWNSAAVELRDIDHDLADRCLVKGNYWSDPRNWSADETEQARIKLDTVFSKARELL